MFKIRFMRYALYFFLVGLGAVLGIAIRHYYNIPIMETINIIDVAALCTTIFFAVYIPEVLDRKIKITDDRKKVLDQRLDELQYLYRKLNRYVQAEGMGATSREVKNLLDICQSRMATLMLLFEHARLNIENAKELQEAVELSAAHRQLFAQQAHGSAQDQDEFLNEEERLYNEIDRVTSLLILKLSDA